MCVINFYLPFVELDITIDTHIQAAKKIDTSITLI